MRRFGVTDAIPTCDLCGQPEGCPDGRWECVLAEWNGETGNHVACEEDAVNAAAAV